MSESPEDAAVELWVDQGQRRYAPGETLSGGYRLVGWRERSVVAIELSVLWYTAGQGEEDLFVHHFQRKREATLPARSDETPNRFECVLPASPLSYDGQIVKVCWAVRLRGFFASGKQRVVETPFSLVVPTRAEDSAE